MLAAVLLARLGKGLTDETYLKLSENLRFIEQLVLLQNAIL